MRHQKRGRTLGRSPSHRKAMFRNMAASLFLTERSDEYWADVDEDLQTLRPKVKGRIVTTLPKAKEVRSLVEKCVTIGKRALPHLERARDLEPDAERNSDAWRTWRYGEPGEPGKNGKNHYGEGWLEWNQAMAPVVAARQRLYKILGDQVAVDIVLEVIAPRFEDRPGGYTRILRIAKPRLGDNGQQAILEFVRDEDKIAKASAKPSFAADDEPAEDESGDAAAESTDSDDSADPQAAADETHESDAPEGSEAMATAEPGPEDRAGSESEDDAKPEKPAS